MVDPVVGKGLPIIPQNPAPSLMIWHPPGSCQIVLASSFPDSMQIVGAHPRAALFAEKPPSFGGGRTEGPGGVPPQGGSGGGGDDNNERIETMRVKIGDLMNDSGVKFGTSGARGLVRDMTDRVSFAYTMGFLQYLMSRWDLKEGDPVAVAGDLRTSTDRIMAAAAAAADYLGCRVINLGKVPSPASAYYGLLGRMPVVMVTGSHIPDDRNGIKFNKVDGEILKDDETGIKGTVVDLPLHLFKDDGSFVEGTVKPMPEATAEAGEMFVARYLDFFGPKALEGVKIALYQHSAVGRDLLERVLKGLGADVISLGRSDKFIPVDTEAIRIEDAEFARRVASEGRFDAIVSTDGDSDRPLVAGRDGRWLRGDVLGIFAAKYLAADWVSTPVSCNSALEKSGLFANVRRTRIGSPFVIASMMEGLKEKKKRVVSYEANGGFLIATDIEISGRVLKALPTRDSFLPIIATILLARQEGRGVADLRASDPQPETASSVIRNFPPEKSAAISKQLATGDSWTDQPRINDRFAPLFGQLKTIDYTDGLRLRFHNDEVVHLRPSGNAPEFRVYTEAASEERAMEINRMARGVIEKMI